MDARAGVLLKERLGWASEWRAGGMTVHVEDTGDVVSGYSTLLEAFEAVGAVTPEEGKEWQERLFVALGIDPEIYFGSSGTSSFAVVTSTLHDPHPGFSRTRVAGSWGAFRSALPGPRETVEVGAGTMRILGVDLFEGALRMRWRVHPMPEGESAREDRLREWAVSGDALNELEHHRVLFAGVTTPQLTDDTGQMYSAGGASSSGGIDDHIGEIAFWPAPTLNARQLIFTWSEGELRVDLPS